MYWGIYKENIPTNFFPKFALDPERIVENYPETRTVDPTTGARRPELAGQFHWGSPRRERGDRPLSEARLETWGSNHVHGDRLPRRGGDAPLLLRRAREPNFLFPPRILGRAHGEPAPGHVLQCDLQRARRRAEGRRRDRWPLLQQRGADRHRDGEGFPWAIRGDARQRPLLLRSIALACAFAMLCVAANTLAMTARERAHEIAVLKSLGFTPGLVLALLLAEVTALCGLAALLGGFGAKLLFSFEGPWVAAMGEDSWRASAFPGGSRRARFPSASRWAGSRRFPHFFGWQWRRSPRRCEGWGSRRGTPLGIVGPPAWEWIEAGVSCGLQSR